MEWTPRQRLLTMLRHGMPDRLPWAPKFATWFAVHKRNGELPAMLEGCEDWHDAAKRIGVDIFDKCAPVVRGTSPSVKVIEEKHDPVTVVRYITPLGELRRASTEVNDYGHTVYTTEYMVKSPEDLRIWRYLIDDMVYEPCYEEYLEAARRIGDAGITMSYLPDSPLHQIFVGVMGYERGSYAFADDPHGMDAICNRILERNEEICQIAVQSPAEVLLTGENTNSDFETPDLFRRYVFPTLKRASELAHAHGKLHWVHACGKLKVLLPQFYEADIDGIESLTPPPYADTYLWEARAAWQAKITIDGGISPHLLVGDLQPGELERYVKDLFRRMAPGNNFVLSVSDDTPTDAFLERLIQVGDLVRAYGQLPIRPDRL